jgi:GNAT superfamily N-acetyltransferase
MITPLSTATLRSGETMAMHCFQPPEKQWLEKLVAFHSHKPPEWVRDITRRLRGEHVAWCDENFHFGTVGDEIVGGVWIGTPRGVKEVGMLGHVFTPEKHRQKGISNFLMRAAMQRFERNGGRALYLDTGNPVARRIYENFGFRAYNPPKPEEAMIFRWVAGDERAFDAWLFASDDKTRVRDVTWGDWTWLEAIFNLPSHPWHVKDASHSVLGESPYEPQFLRLMEEVESGTTTCVVAENSSGRVMAVARVAMGVERRDGVLELFAHPNSFAVLPMLVREIVVRAEAMGLKEVRSVAASADAVRVEVLQQGGFREIQCNASALKTRRGVEDEVWFARTADAA